MSAHAAEELMGQALALIRQGRLADADQLLAALCERAPENGKAWLVRGAIRAESGDSTGAIRYLGTAVGLDPGNAQAHFALCRLNLSRGNLGEAIAHVEKVVELDPGRGEAWLALGSLSADVGRFEQAERASRVAVDLLPGVPEPAINLANALISQGKNNEAIALCDRIRAQGPSRAGIWHSLGLAFRALGRSRDAEQCLQTAIAMEPANAAALLTLGEINAARDQIPQALSLYRRSRDLDPANPRVHFQLGKVLLPGCSERHSRLLQQLESDHQYRDAAEAAGVARELAAGFRYDDAAVEDALVRFFDGFDPSKLYPAEWWNDALMQFGDRRHAADTALRSIFSTVFSWSLPCRQALDALAGFCGQRLASYGSGSGYWEWLLATHHGVAVACHDRAVRHRFLPVRPTSHSEARIDPDDTIFLAWLPGDAAIDPDIESLLDQVRPGQKLVLVGEPADENGHPRTCGTHRFFRYLRENFETRATVPLANYACFQDRVELLERRRGSGPRSSLSD